MLTCATLIVIWILSGCLSSLKLKGEPVIARVLFGLICGYTLVALILETILFWS